MMQYMRGKFRQRVSGSRVKVFSVSAQNLDICVKLKPHKEWAFDY